MGGADANAGAGGAAGVTGTLEYADDFDALGDWQLMADQGTGSSTDATAEIKGGQLVLHAEQGGGAPIRCPGDVTASPALARRRRRNGRRHDGLALRFHHQQRRR